MVNAVPSPALRACTLSAFVIYGADMGVFPLMDVPEFGRRDILGKRYPSVMFQPSAIPTAMYCPTALYGTCDHTLSVVLYCHEVIGASLASFSAIENQRGSRIHLVVVICAV